MDTNSQKKNIKLPTFVSKNLRHINTLSLFSQNLINFKRFSFLKKLKIVDAGITITTLDEDVKKVLEPKAAHRLKDQMYWKKIATEGIDTWAFFVPVLPYFSESIEKIEELQIAFSKAEVSQVSLDTTNLYPKADIIKRILRSSCPGLIGRYEKIFRDRFKFQEELRWRVKIVAKNIISLTKCVYKRYLLINEFMK